MALITFMGLLAALRQGGLGLGARQEADVVRLAERCALGAAGKIDYLQFCRLVNASHGQRRAAAGRAARARLSRLLAPHSGRLLQVFEAFDADADGRIDTAELTAGLRSLGLPMAERQVADLMAVAAPAGDGQVDYDRLHPLLYILYGLSSNKMALITCMPWCERSTTSGWSSSSGAPGWSSWPRCR